MKKIQQIVQKFSNKMSAALLLMLTSILFFVWTAGLSVPAASFLYDNSPKLIAMSILILLGLNIYKARGADFFYLGAAVVIFLFFSFFREIRNESLSGDLLLPLVIIFVLVVKWIEFTGWDRAMYLLVFYLFLGITVYRVFTEIQVPEGQSIWLPGNSLSDIWINTNTIGGSLLTLALLISGFASSFEKWYVRMLALPAVVAALLGIWVCQSRGALVALIVFAVLDILPKFSMKIIRAPFIAYTATIILALPLSYLAGSSEKVNLFTGREDIWNHFYQTLSEKTEQIWLGMQPFVFHRGHQVLGNHNSYNSILNLYGLVGFGLVVLLLLGYIGKLTLRADLSNGQMTFLWAFFAILMQSFMEDTLTSYPWLPLIYLLLAMASHRYDGYDEYIEYDEPEIPGHIESRDFEDDTEGSFSRIKRYH